VTKDTFYITTPIYYVNAIPHVGSAYTTIVADVIARWHRLHGEKVYFLTGVDEHGAKQQKSAEEAGVDTQTYVDSMAPHFRELWQALNISNDDFIRTTEERHKRAVVPFIEQLQANDDVYTARYEGWYCVRCEEFKTDTDVVDGNCSIHGTPVEWLAEDNHFFRLSKYTDRLIELYETNPSFLQPKRAYNEMYALLKQGLIDTPISRRIKWGIPFPGDPEQVVYVWVEALTNYITAIGYERDAATFERIWPADLHLMAKEIVRFHAVIWPAMLMSLDLPLPKHVFAHGWLLAGGEKISKSGRGITDLAPRELIASYGVDAYRYHFTRGIKFGGDDASFTLEDMHARYTADLVNGLGNLASRTLAMIERYFGGVVPNEPTGAAPEVDLLAEAERADPIAMDHMQSFEVTQAFDAIWEVVRRANQYLVEREPWKLAKDESQMPLVGSVLATTAHVLAHLAALLSPVMPDATRELWSRLGYEGAPALNPESPAGHTIRVGDALFPRLEAPA
jgi:methionyl-tRNA synthetase